MKNTSWNITCTFTLLGLLCCASPSISAELTVGNFLVANGDKITEYTREGIQVQQFDVPRPIDGVEVTCRDLVVESLTRFHVTTRNDFATYLETFDTETNSWEFRTVEGWTMSGVTYYGSIGIGPRYIYATDIANAEDTYGIIRFDLADLDSSQRFFQDNPGDPRWHEVKYGLDGYVYALSRGPGFNLEKIDPATMERIESFQIYDSSITGVTIDSSGHFYVLTLNNTLIHYDETGLEVERLDDVGRTDIELSYDGVLVAGSAGEKVTLISVADLNNSFAIDTSENDRGGGFDENFVAWIQDPTCNGATHVGSNGDDVISINATGLQTIHVAARSGNDVITIFGDSSNLQSLSVCGGDGDDTVSIKVDFPATVMLGKGNDNFSATRMGGHIVYGGDGRDVLIGSNGDDILLGQNGQDRIDGKNGNDLLEGGEAIDTINGGNGNDVILGEDGNDILNGNGGHDIVDGGPGADVCHGNNGSDILLGRAGNDTLRGHGGADFLFGGFGLDLLDGGTENSFLAGGNSDDILRARGGKSNAYLGGHGRDDLYWSTDVDSASRYVEESRDDLIPLSVWESRGIRISLDRFIELIQSALNRIEDAGLAPPQL